MNKKIIYLLSLLMVLSLVFASCKKDGNKGITDPGGSNYVEEEIRNNTGGVIDNWEGLEEYSDSPIQNYPVIDKSTSGSDYYRNPVVVALGGANVLIITEKRVGYKGSKNDIGVDGKNKSDIIYLLSTNGGDSFSEAQTVGNASTDGSDAVCSPIVYYKKGSDKIYIIASGGAGLSRTDTLYEDRYPQSKYRYIIGTVIDADAKASITWGEWQDFYWDLIQIKHGQYGSQSARGVITDDGYLILPIMEIDLGDNNNPIELMTLYTFKILANDNLSFAFENKIGVGINYLPLESNKNLGRLKAASAIDYTSGDFVDLLIIPNEKVEKFIDWFKIRRNGWDNAHTDITSGEGSFGFLKIDNGWYGSQQYDPQLYATTPSSAGVNGSTALSEMLLSRALPNNGANYLNFFDINNHSLKYTTGLQIAKTSKSSSIDVLADGTIIMATEKERDTTAAGNKFDIYFSRYTQKYLTKNIK